MIRRLAAFPFPDGEESPISALHSRLRSAAAARTGGWLLLLIACALYLSTLDTGLLPRELEGGDLITHQYAQVEARPGNAPGYPFYTMGGWLWFHASRWSSALIANPLPNPIPILSSYSTLWALLALWLFYQTLLMLSRSAHWPGGHWPLAWLITAFFAVTYFFWYYATTTEQYSSAVAHTLAIVYVYLRWQGAVSSEPSVVRSRTREGERASGATSLLLFLAFLCGLSLAHMVTVAMIVPPLVIAVLWTQPGLLRRPWIMLSAVIAAALPLLGYIYVFVRGTAHPEWWGAGNWTDGDQWFWHFVRTSQGQEELSWGLQPGAPVFGNGFPQLIWQELSVPLLVLGLIGIAFFGRQRFVFHGSGGHKLVLLLYGTLLLYLILCWVDRFGNWFQVILPAYPLILSGLLPLGIWSIARLGRVTPWLSSLPLLLLCVAIFWRVDASLPAADSRNRPEDTALWRPALLLDQALPTGAALFAEKEDALGLHYLIEIWGIRPDLRVVSGPQANHVLANEGVVLSSAPAVSLLRSELTLANPLMIESLSPDWVALYTGQVPATRQPTVRLDRSLGDGIILVGYSVETGPIGEPVLRTAEPTLHLILYWQLEPGATPANWSISVRPLQDGVLLTGADGAPIQRDSTGPVHGLRPFPDLTSDQLITDAYSFANDERIDGFQVVLYQVVDGAFENLAVVEWTDLHSLESFQQP